MRIQTIDPGALGYRPADLQSATVCQRCFGLTHYGRETVADLTAAQYERELRQLRRMPGIAVQIVDITDLAGTLSPRRFQTVIGDHASVLVANKSDLLPKGANTARLELVLRRLAHQSKLSSVQSVHVVSARTGHGVSGLLSVLTELAGRERPIFFVGYANVGTLSLACR